MAFVSKKPLKEDVQEQINRQFVKTIVDLRTERNGKHLLSELLSETEYVMLAKRLMMIFLLTEGISQYQVRRMLGVSSSTVARIAHKIDDGGYEFFVKICSRKKNKEILWNNIEVIVRLGMPSMGRDRWKFLDS